VYLVDMSSGVTILRLKKSARGCAMIDAITAPSVASDSLEPKPISSLDRSGRFVCSAVPARVRVCGTWCPGRHRVALAAARRRAAGCLDLFKR